MSNVLIGIIGVILFIGLALAGTLFLGSEFQRSANNSRAAAATQGASQVANAINLHNVQTGIEFASNGAVGTLVSGNYLKSVPRLPVNNAEYWVARLHPTTGLAQDANPAQIVVGVVSSREVCNAINRQTSGQDAPTHDLVGIGGLTSVAGCFVNSEAIVAPAIAANSFVAYVRI